MASPVGQILGLGHIVVGAGSIVAPFTMARAFRITQGSATAFITRAFGSRDLIMGCGIMLYTRESPENRTATLACGVIHAIDVVNAIVSYAQGYLRFEALLVAGGIDSMLVGLCWWDLSS